MEHQELWVPADQLAAFNSHIEGKIEVVDAYFGAGFGGVVPERSNLKGMDAAAQLLALERIRGDGRMDFLGEIAANCEAVFAHFPFWRSHDFTLAGLSTAERDALLRDIQNVWEHAFPLFRLPCTGAAGE